MAVVLGGLAPRSTALDNNRNQLEGAFGVHALKVGDKTFVYVAGFRDDGISAFELRSDGSLTNLQNIDGGPPTGPLELDQAANFASVTVNGTSYLYVNAADDDGISAFRINASGTLTNIQNITDDAVLELDDTAGKMTVAEVGGASFLVASGKDDNGLSVFQVSGNGTLTNTDNVTDDGTVELDDAYDLANIRIGGQTFLYVAAEDDNGLSVWELDGSGKLRHVQNVEDDAHLELEGAGGVTAAKVGGRNFLVASGTLDDGLSVFSVDGEGKLASVFNLSDNAALGLDAAGPLTTFVLEGETFVAVSGTRDDALSVFHLSAGGVLTEATTIFDDAGVTLNHTLGNAFALVGGTPLLIGAGLVDNGVTTFEIGGGDDWLVGTGGADLLLGFAGDDRLDGAAGADILRGGRGDDVYVVNDAADTVEEASQAGRDLVRASISYKLGSQVEDLKLLNGAEAGTGNGLANLMTGNGASNDLDGLRGKDTLRGRGGADELKGGQGKDKLFGGKGADDLWGGKGGDRLLGQGGADDFIYTKLSDSGIHQQSRDRIEGFGNQDEIVLKRIDADRTTKGNQAFALDADGSFDAGEIRLREVKAGLIVEMNVDNDAKAEMAILLKGFVGTLDGSDFVF